MPTSAARARSSPPRWRSTTSAKANPNVKVELVSADHQNKPDVGSQIARQWFDVDKVDMIVDVPNSGVALAVSQVADQKNKVFLVSGAAASDLTGEVQRQHHPLDLRHLDARQRHRQGAS